MTSEKVAGQECADPSQVYRLSDDEIASLRKEMQSAGQWMMNELKRRRLCDMHPNTLTEYLPNESPMS